MSRRTRRPWLRVPVLAALFALPGLGLLAGCGPLSPPQITNVSPAPSQGAVHTSDLLVVTFDMPMNQRSVEDRMFMRTRKNHKPPDCSLARATQGRATGCHFRWRDGARVLELVHPDHPWRTVTTYRVEIQGGIRAASGAVNSLSHSWEFSTEGGPQVSSTSPGGGGSLGPNQPITIDFSRDMQLRAVERATTLTPTPTGGYTWATSRSAPGRFLIEPTRPLTPGASYTLHIAGSALDTDGNRLQHPALVHFTVGALGSSPSVVFPAGPSPDDYTEVLAATPLARSGDPASLRVLASAPSGQHYVHTWPSPDGTRLALELAGNQPLSVLDLSTGKSATVLGSTGAEAAAWNPAGTALAFVVSGDLRVYTVADATTVTLSSAPGMAGPLSWRPDGQVVSAVATPSGDPSRIALLSPALKAITFLPTSTAAALAEGNPAWSPGGALLAFSVGSGPDAAIWVYQPLAASAAVALVAEHAGQPLAFLDLDTLLVRRASGALATLSTTTGQETRLVGARAGAYPLAAAATPSGRQFAYTVELNGRVQVLLANDDGTGLQDLTDFTPSKGLDAGPPTFTGS